MTDKLSPPVPADLDLRPLVSEDVDLRDFQYMPLDVVRLRDSDLAANPDGEVFRAAVMSWCVSWHQQPAASLPDDDAVLARLLGYGRDIKGWVKLRHAGALRGFVKCSDGRLYHPVVAEKARDAWQAKQRQHDRTKKARDARLSQAQLPGLSQRDDVSVTENVTGSKGEGRDSKGIAPYLDARQIDQDFEAWRQVFPRKVGRGQALRAYRTARKKPGITAEILLVAAKRFAASRAGEDEKFTPYPATWLNGERWLDGAGNGAANGADAQPDRELSQSRAEVRSWCLTGVWQPRGGGGPPGSPDCRVPKAVMDEFATEIAERRRINGLTIQKNLDRT